jgi:hypothetical protein
MNTEIKDEIRIENGRIIGLGIAGKQSISIIALDTFFTCLTAQEAVDFFCETLKNLAILNQYLHEKEETESFNFDLFKEEILSYLPDCNGIFRLWELTKLFKS